MSQNSAHLISTLYNQVLDIVFPPRCAGCGTWSQDLFCSSCWIQLKPIKPPFCFICGHPFDPLSYSAAECADCRGQRSHTAPSFRALRSAYTFEGPVREAIHRFKYQDKIALAAPLARLLYDLLCQQPSSLPAIPCDRLKLLIPVPLHPWRRYRRGYNQSALLARELSRHLPVPVSEVLRRVRHTVPQVELSAQERTANVAGAFAVDASALKQVQSRIAAGPVLLIDDVCTTGATLRECVATLKQSGVNDIYALTLARQL